jgi:hypothetical protein
MKTLFYLIFLIFEFIKTDLVINRQTNCPIFYCTNIEAPTNGICFTYAREGNNALIQLKNCPKNQECIYNLWFPIVYSTVSCTSMQVNFFSGNDYGTLVEQDFCSNNEQCSSNNCVNNTCIGKDLGSSCNNSTECSWSYYCESSSHKCERRKQEGLSCRIDEECVNDSECLNGKCTKLYSLKAGESVLPFNRSQFCFSNYSLNGICEDLLNDGNAPYFCDAIVGCNYTTSVSKSSYFDLMHCNCDFRGNGFAFCQLGTNSNAWAKYINQIKDSLSNNPCHFYNKYRCNAMPYNTTTAIFNAFLDVAQMDTRLSCIYPSQPSDNPAVNCPGGNSCLGEYLRIWMFYLLILMFALI